MFTKLYFLVYLDQGDKSAKTVLVVRHCGLAIICNNQVTFQEPHHLLTNLNVQSVDHLMSTQTIGDNSANTVLVDRH